MTDASGGAAADSHRALATFALHRSTGSGAWVEATGWSMTPLIQPGDTLYVEFGTNRPRLGEIVLFPSGGRTVAHRLVWRKRSRGGALLVTRGDGSLYLDPPFPTDQTFGIVRACRRAQDGAVTPVVDSGPRAAAVAAVSLTLGSLLAAVERLPPPVRRPLGRAARWVAPPLLARAARAAAWSDRGFDADRFATPQGANGRAEPARSSLLKLG
jgi:hypothetical protein